MGIKEKIQRHRGGLLENTVMLYIFSFATWLWAWWPRATRCACWGWS